MNCSIRGAITADSNTREDILLNTRQLLKEIIELNNVKIEDIVSILFTATKDLDAAYPAVAARELGIVDAALMCAQEMFVEGSLKMCIRVQMDVQTDKKQSEMKFVYLKNAEVLRPDKVKKQKKIAVAIDGPAGSGKSTLAKELA
ncbi:MAG: chorismate mutase, partial [Firmicutes bacterium]|nr:chorismate mutase [Bacillota bacterium]